MHLRGHESSTKVHVWAVEAVLLQGYVGAAAGVAALLGIHRLYVLRVKQQQEIHVPRQPLPHDGAELLQLEAPRVVQVAKGVLAWRGKGNAGSKCLAVCGISAHLRHNTGSPAVAKL